MASVTEIAEGIYRINVEIPEKPVTFSLFLIDDEQPTLIETSYQRVFDETLEAVSSILRPSSLRYIAVPHFEGDECGALNRFLDAAPNATVLGSPTGCATSLPDFCQREPQAVDDSTVLDLGSHRLRFLITPWVHAWDSLLAFDERTQTLFSSDLFLQPGSGPATTDADVSDSMVEYARIRGIFPSQRHIEAALDKIEPLTPRTIACHHGSVLTGHVTRYVDLLKETDITVEAL
jgi:flavorubredoxin